MTDELKAKQKTKAQLLAADVDSLAEIRLSANWMAASGEPGEDAALYATVAAVAKELCPRLGIAIPVGKDSLSMQTRWSEGGLEKSVVAPVSLIVSAFAPVADVRRTLTPALELAERPSSLWLIDLAAGFRARDRPLQDPLRDGQGQPGAGGAAPVFGIG